MSNPFEALEQEPTFDVGEQKTVDFFRFKSLVPDVKIKFKNSQFYTTKNQESASLLVCSSQYGYVVVGSCTGFTLAQTEKLRSSVYKTAQSETTFLDETVPVTVKEGAVNILALSADECQLFVGVAGGTLLTYNVQDIVQKDTVEPVQSHTLPVDIMHIQPNPEAHPNIIAIITKNSECQLINYMKKQVVAVMPNATAMSWSPKGKQIVVGTHEGAVRAYDVSGTQKDEIFPPAAMKAGHREETKNRYVNGIVWVESNVFLVIYSRPQDESGDADPIHTAYIVNRKNQTEEERYVMMEEVTPIYGFDTPESHFYTCVLRNFGQAKTLIVLANSAATDLAVVGQTSDGEWATWLLEDESTPALPISSDDVTDTYPLGLAIDLSASEPLPSFDSAESEEPVAAAPVLYILTTEGLICSYHIYSNELAKTGQQYESMVPAKGIQQIPTPTEVKQDNVARPAAESKISSFSSLRTSSPSGITVAFGTSLSKDTAKNSFSRFGFDAKDNQKISFASLAKPTSIDNHKKQPSSSSFRSPGADSAPTFGTTSPIGLSGTSNTSALLAAATPSRPFGGFKNESLSASTTMPFGETSFQTNSFPSKFAPSILNSNSNELKLSGAKQNEKKAHQTYDEAVQSTSNEQPLENEGKSHDKEIAKDSTGCSMAFKEVQKSLDEEPVEQGQTQFNQDDNSVSHIEEKSGQSEKSQEVEETEQDEHKRLKQPYELKHQKLLQKEDNQEEEKEQEKDRIAEEKRLEEERIAKEKRREEERIAEERRRLLETIECTKFTTHQRDSSLMFPITRTSGLSQLANDFEVAYLDTLEEVENAVNLVQDISDTLLIQEKHTFTRKSMSDLNNQDCVWSLGEMVDVGFISDELSNEYEKVNALLQRISTRFLELCEAVDNLSVKKKVIEDYMDQGEFDTPLDYDDFKSDLVNQTSSVESKCVELEDQINDVRDRLEKVKQGTQLSVNKKTDSSKFSLYTLRRVLRDIDRSIVKNLDHVNKLEDAELKAHLKGTSVENNAGPSKDDSRDKTSGNLEKLNSRIYGKKSFLTDLFQGTKLRGDLLSASINTA
ncbi:hypothetical protein BD560DRAFT_407524 [Blakeslea trispora]|nr:hypothetical protein BD560DRAFT_407524 [Blakeslea trispora]